MGLSQLAATGVSLCSLSISTVTGSLKFLLSDSASLPIAMAIALPSIVTARLGAKFAARLPDDVLALAFNGASVLLIPTHFLVQRYAARRWSAPVDHHHHGQQQPEQQQQQQQPKQQEQPEQQGQLGLRKLSHGAFGCVSGLISAIMGIGGLPLTMSYLTAFSGLPHHLVQGTAQLSVAPSAITSAVSRLHVVPAATAAAVSAGAMGGAALGASIALRTSEERLRALYMLSLVVLGGRSVVAAAHNLRSILARRRVMPPRPMPRP